MPTFGIAPSKTTLPPAPRVQYHTEPTDKNTIAPVPGAKGAPHMRAGRQVSFILATHNRHEVVVDTLRRLAAPDWVGLPRANYEVIVVDNASADGTPDTAADLADTVIRRRRNAGSCAKAYGVHQAAGEFIVFLDDDSYPRQGAVLRMIDHFRADPRLGAAGFTVHLPNGHEEGAALPAVFVGCGVGLRTAALRAVGGLDPTFFMQAEEYDLSFRLTAGGWKVEVFNDLAVEHLKTAQARRHARIAFYDIRNNLRVAARYLPEPYWSVYRQDWLERYAWLAARARTRWAHMRGRVAGLARALWERPRYQRWRLDHAGCERFLGWRFIHAHLRKLAGEGVRRVLLVDLGKNIYPFWRAARDTGIDVPAILDDRFAAPGRVYRGTPIVSVAAGLEYAADALVVSNAGPVHARATRLRLAKLDARPVHDWLGLPVVTPTPEEANSARPFATVDCRLSIVD